MSESRRTSVARLAAAVLTGLAGILAFNVVDGIFGFVEALMGLAACIAITAFVVGRAPPPEEERDA